MGSCLRVGCGELLLVMQSGHFSLEFLNTTCDGCDSLVIFVPLLPIFLHSLGQLFYLYLC